MDQRVKNEISRKFDRFVNRTSKRVWAITALASVALDIIFFLVVII